MSTMSTAEERRRVLPTALGPGAPAVLAEEPAPALTARTLLLLSPVYPPGQSLNRQQAGRIAIVNRLSARRSGWCRWHWQAPALACSLLLANRCTSGATDPRLLVMPTTQALAATVPCHVCATHLPPRRRSARRGQRLAAGLL